MSRASVQVEAHFHVMKGKDNDVKLWTEEDYGANLLPPRNSHHRIGITPAQNRFYAMLQTATTLSAPRVIPLVTVPVIHKIWVRGS